MIAPMVELRDLHCFDVLARTMHFGRAAEELHTSQSTLSGGFAGWRRRWASCC